MYSCRPEVTYFLGRQITQKKVSHFWATRVAKSGVSLAVPNFYVALFINLKHGSDRFARMRDTATSFALHAEQ